MNLTLGILALWIGPGIAQGVHQGIPPYQLAEGRNWDKSEQVAATYFVQGVPHALMYGKSVEFKFILRETEVTDSALDVRTVTNSVAYWPTAVSYLTDSLYVVAGKRNQRTVIELWQVPMPYLEDFPIGGVPQGFAGGGEVLYKATIYSASVVGRDMVRLVFPNRGKSNTLFVQFYDSRDLYEIDYANAVPPGTGTNEFPMSLVLSASQEPGVPSVPELADSRLQYVETSDHVSEGYVYMMFPSFDSSLEAGATGALLEPLFIFDHDRDGEIDEALRLGEEELETRSMWKAPDSSWNDRGHATRMWPY